MSNKNSATEDQLGLLHSLITKIHLSKASAIEEILNEAKKQGLESAMIAAMVDTKDLSVMQKWVEYNKVTCCSAIQDEESELAKTIRKIKETQAGKIVSFIEEEHIQ